ncbi:MAG: hypothetical protein Ct9H90mP27_6680 [Gammaproteobacteria bacterium]|nr:MAG: hypothetical protein Ct9H90mP27_6680 [Gammaproteobacteria bacterium]
MYPQQNRIGYPLSTKSSRKASVKSERRKSGILNFVLYEREKRKQPTYRLVAADSRSPRNGRFIEIIGTYEPRQEPSRINIDNDRPIHWLRNGAKPTERFEKLLRISGAWEEFTGKPLEPIEYKTKEEASVEEPVERKLLLKKLRSLGGFKKEGPPAEEVEEPVAEEESEKS